MAPPERLSDSHHRRIRLYGVIFLVVGLCLFVYSGWSLLEIYNRKTPMFQMEAVFTPEKGRMWSQFLAGGSVALMGVLLVIKSKMGVTGQGKSRQRKH
jgi:hypothetical protein